MASGADKGLILSAVGKYLQVLRENGVPVKRAYLYGSWATGRATEGSDIDVAVFLDQDDLDGFDDDARLMHLRRKVDLRIEPRGFSRRDEADPDPFVREILATGEPIL